MIIRAIEYDTGKPKDVDISIHALGQYWPYSPKRNGLDEPYACINICAKTHLSFVMRFYTPGTIRETWLDGDEARGTPYRIRNFALTFFDFDQDRNNTGVERVTAAGFDEYKLTHSTQVKTITNGSRTTFHSSSYGDWKNNPVDLVYLTEEQKDRSVSLLFSNTSEVNVTIASNGDPRGTIRQFEFVIGPVLFCEESRELPSWYVHAQEKRKERHNQSISRNKSISRTDIEPRYARSTDAHARNASNEAIITSANIFGFSKIFGDLPFHAGVLLAALIIGCGVVSSILIAQRLLLSRKKGNGDIATSAVVASVRSRGYDARSVATMNGETVPLRLETTEDDKDKKRSPEQALSLFKREPALKLHQVDGGAMLDSIMASRAHACGEDTAH